DTMSGLLSKNVRYAKFCERLNSLKYQHAVEVCGQKLLHLVMRTLICGDIDQICDCVRMIQRSNTKYKNSFTKDEVRRLEMGDNRRYDISLLVKIIKMVCGLAPAGNNCWTQFTSDNELLEYLITTLKEWRNDLVHTYDSVLTDDQLDNYLCELRDLAKKIVSTLEVRAGELGKHFSVNEATETLQVVHEIIAEVNAY
ncbi:unnamed protein product, partial [Meganyctiphanes norvegica]